MDKDVESKHAKVIRAFADEHCLNIVSQRVDADCFVVTNPASPSKRIATVTALVGGYVASIGAFLRGRGVCFHHVPALRIPRKLWASDEVKTKRAAQWKITKHLVKNHPRSAWKLIKISDDFASMKAKAIAKTKSSSVVGIVLGDDEKAANPSRMAFDDFIVKNTTILWRHTVAVCRMKLLRRVPSTS